MTLMGTRGPPLSRLWLSGGVDQKACGLCAAGKTMPGGHRELRGSPGGLRTNPIMQVLSIHLGAWPEKFTCTCSWGRLLSVFQTQSATARRPGFKFKFHVTWGNGSVSPDLTWKMKTILVPSSLGCGDCQRQHPQRAQWGDRHPLVFNEGLLL